LHDDKKLERENNAEMQNLLPRNAHTTGMFIENYSLRGIEFLEREF
jgi:hypothetical protein